jgi:L-aminopeptidase/D-esterase-like protein
MNPAFEAVVQATEEAIINAMLGAQTMTGYHDHRVIALPHDRLRQAMQKYGR